MQKRSLPCGQRNTQDAKNLSCVAVYFSAPIIHELASQVSRPRSIFAMHTHVCSKYEDYETCCIMHFTETISKQLCHEDHSSATLQYKNRLSCTKMHHSQILRTMRLCVSAIQEKL